jgi:nucleotide-binding universal stress UspA family protein
MYQRILVPVDGSPTSDRGLEEAIQLAKLTHARLRLMHVVDQLSLTLYTQSFARNRLDELRAGGAMILDKAQTVVREHGSEVDTVLVDDFSGPVDETVASEASKWPADLIVLGTHGRRGVGRWMLGSDAERILRIAPCPVLLVRAPEIDIK